MEAHASIEVLLVPFHKAVSQFNQNNGGNKNILAAGSDKVNRMMQTLCNTESCK
jgi:hypothetical protein